MDILSSFGIKGYVKDTGAEKFDLGLIELQEKYPTLCRGTTKPPSPHKRTVNSTLGLDRLHDLASSASSSSSVSIPSIPVPRPSTSKSSPGFAFDYSCTKLAKLDQPGGCFTAEPRMGKRKLKAIKKKLRDQTKGPNWFEMTAPEITDDRKNDLEALRLRGALDTKRFYKRNAGAIKPKHFHVGKIVGNAADFYNSRVPKKQRKRTIAEEMMSEINH